jgi:hypothetical protein
MRRMKATRTWRNILFGRRMVQLALMGTAMVTAIAAAQIAGKPDDAAMGHAIMKQQVSDGQSVKIRTTKPSDALTIDQMLAATVSYEADMDKAVQHAETLRIQAYRSKDIIRMNFIDSRLASIKEIRSIAQPVSVAIKQPGLDLFHVRAKFTIIQQGWERVNQMMAEIEASIGDTLDPTSQGTMINEAGDKDSTSVTDPTQPASPTTEFERPPAASPFR